MRLNPAAVEFRLDLQASPPLLWGEGWGEGVSV
jgi:hypothetical protein